MSGRAREAVLVVAGFTIVTLAMTYPVARTLTTALPNDPGDPLLNAWVLAWDAEHIRHGFRGFWDLPAFFPNQHTLTYTEHLLGIAVLVAPIYWATGNAIFAYNIAFLLSFVLAGAGMYALVRSLTGRRDAAWIAGLIYAFCPYRMGMISHVQVLWSGWLPVALWALHRYLRTESRAAMFGFTSAFLVQALSNNYFLYFSLIPVAVIMIVDGFAGSNKTRPTGVGRTLWVPSCVGRTLWVRRCRDVALAFITIAVVLAPIAAAYYQARVSQGLTRSYAEINSYRADLGSYLHANDSIRALRWLPGIATLEGDLFPGLTALVLAAIGLTWRREAVTYATIGAIGFVLSLGPEPAAWGRPLFQHAPYEWLMRMVPGFNGMRVPARLSVLVFLAIAVLAGLGVQSALEHVAPPTRRWIARLLTFAVLVEGYAVPLPVASIPPLSADDRGAYLWLRDSPSGAAVEFPIQRPLSHSPLVYPTREPSGYLNALYQYRTLFHRHPIVNGHSGYEPLLNVRLRQLIEDNHLAEALALLRSVGVRYALVHPPESSTQPLARVTAAEVAGETDQVAERMTFGHTTVFRLTPWKP